MMLFPPQEEHCQFEILLLTHQLLDTHNSIEETLKISDGHLWHNQVIDHRLMAKFSSIM